MALGNAHFMEYSTLPCKISGENIDFILYNQSLLLDIHDPWIELLLFCSCRGSCTGNNLLRTVSPDKVEL